MTQPSEQSASIAGGTPITDLTNLVKKGVSPTTLANCDELTKLIADELQLEQATLAQGKTVNLLKEVLHHVAQEQCGQALRREGEYGRWSKASMAPPCFKAAAAAELLNVANEPSFDGLLEIRRELNRTPYSVLAAKEYNQGRTSKSRLRAALWVDAESTRTSKPDREEPEFLRAFEAAIKEYLANGSVRMRLATKYVESQSPDTNQTDTSKSEMKAMDNQKNYIIIGDKIENNVRTVNQLINKQYGPASAPPSTEIESKIDRILTAIENGQVKVSSLVTVVQKLTLAKDTLARYDLTQGKAYIEEVVSILGTSHELSLPLGGISKELDKLIN